MVGLSKMHLNKTSLWAYLKALGFNQIFRVWFVVATDDILLSFKKFEDDKIIKTHNFS